jgi:hypothetical protein
MLSGCTAPVHKEAEIRKEKFSFILIFLVATTFFTWAQLTAQNVPIKISRCTTGIDKLTQNGWRNSVSVGVGTYLHFPLAPKCLTAKILIRKPNIEYSQMNIKIQKYKRC